MKKILVTIFVVTLISNSIAQNSLNQTISEQKLHYITLKSELARAVQMYNTNLSTIEFGYNMPVMSLSADSLIEALRPIYELQSPYSRNALEIHADRLMMRNRGMKYFISELTAQQQNLTNLWNVAQVCDTKYLSLTNDFQNMQDQLASLEEQQQSRKSGGRLNFIYTFVSGLVVGGLVGAVVF